MDDIELSVIRNFVAVAETGSLKLASRRAARTIGALSYQINRLETALGQKLFIRNGRGMTPSKEGDHFLTQARILLQTYDKVLDNKNRSPLSTPGKLLGRDKIDTKQYSAGLETEHVNFFEKNLETPLLQNIFSMWNSYRADGKQLALDDLIKAGRISIRRDNVFLVDSNYLDFRCIWASEEPTRLFQFDKYGFGLTLEQIWKSSEIFQSRRKVFAICKNTDAPVFFSGNAPIPWHSDFYSKTIRQFVSTRLDRLLLPVKIKSKNGSHPGILQIAEFRNRISLPKREAYGSSVENRATSLNLISNVCVSL